ncbi:MAG: hypothetical protein KatS3mg032_2146 [Cyclobacteriaceae bacterium]|nr:MAG: hypothetical protein KatS3mg032_2146 [Cyclobacteriaceae bacterium]
MKKLLAILALTGVMATVTLAQSTDGSQPATEQTGGPSFHQVLKEKFIEGDVRFMTPVLICLILGLAFSIERIITLNMATTNTKKLLAQIEDALSKGGVNAALEVTRNTRGPVASIFTQGFNAFFGGD